MAKTFTLSLSNQSTFTLTLSLVNHVLVPSTIAITNFVPNCDVTSHYKYIIEFWWCVCMHVSGFCWIGRRTDEISFLGSVLISGICPKLYKRSKTRWMEKNGLDSRLVIYCDVTLKKREFIFANKNIPKKK